MTIEELAEGFGRDLAKIGASPYEAAEAVGIMFLALMADLPAEQRTELLARNEEQANGLFQAPTTREAEGRTETPANPAPTHGGPAPAAVATDGEHIVIPPVPMRSGKPDYRTWVVALFVPKLRTTKDPRTLAFLTGDYAETLEQAKPYLNPGDRADLEKAIEEQWRTVEQATA